MAQGRQNGVMGKLPGWLGRLALGKTAQAAYLSLFDQGVISLSNFLATIYLARQVSAVELGIYAVGFSLLRFVRAVQEGLIVQPLNTFGAGMEREDFRGYLSKTLLFQLFFGVFSAGAALLVGSLLVALGSDTAGPAVMRLWFVFITWPLYEFFRRVFYTRGELGRAAVLSTITNLVRFGVMLWLAGEGRLSGSAGMDAIGWGALAGLPFGLWGVRKYLGGQIDWASIKVVWAKNWGFGRWMLGALLANFVALEVFPLVVAGVIGYAAAGVYRALENLVAAVHVILRAMDTFITPYAARAYQHDGQERLRLILRRTYLFSGVPIGLILIAAVVFSSPLLELLYGDAYLGAQDGLIWLSVFYLLWYAYWPVQSALKAIKRSRPVFNANLAAIVCMFTLGLAALHIWGLKGAFIGQSLNALVVNLVLWRAWVKFRNNANEGEVPGVTGIN